MATVYCPSCDALAVNGVATHEHGCPNSHQRWTKRRGDYLIPANEKTPAWIDNLNPRRKKTSK